jgi:hypothetical protein
VVSNKALATTGEAAIAQAMGQAGFPTLLLSFVQRSAHDEVCATARTTQSSIAWYSFVS